jgi:hypothetical protein
MRTPKSTSRRSGMRLGILLGAVTAVSMLIVALTGATPLAAFASSSPEQAKAKSYKATRAFVVDKETGKARMPTQKEVDEVVANLSALGQRSAETLQQASQATGAVSMDLDGGFAGILLARPNEDGTWETKCVFTLEEGVEFLGIVADDAAR